MRSRMYMEHIKGVWSPYRAYNSNATVHDRSSNKFMNSFSDHLLLSVSFLCISCLFMENEHNSNFL